MIQAPAVTNALAYYCAELITAVKCFVSWVLAIIFKTLTITMNLTFNNEKVFNDKTCKPFLLVIYKLLRC
jgi:hypothetical protein